MKKLTIFLFATAFLLASCKKTYSGYCVTDGESGYMLTNYSIDAATNGAANRKAENALNKNADKNQMNWTCDLK